MKPRVFVGSSSESLNIAYVIQELLPDMEVTVWSQGIFQLSSNTLDDLVATLNNTDFGIFVFSPDDLVTIREQQLSSARDNVVFELGLFIGRLGKQRSYFVIPKGRTDFHLPSDLLGINPATFDPSRQDNNLRAALGPACNQIRTAIENARIDRELVRKLTPRLIYLLRHLEADNRVRRLSHFAFALAAYDEYGDGLKLPFEQLSKEGASGWQKASEYALRHLQDLNLVEIQSRTLIGARITELGRSILNSPKIKDLFRESFKQPLVLKE